MRRSPRHAADPRQTVFAFAAPAAPAPAGPERCPTCRQIPEPGKGRGGWHGLLLRCHCPGKLRWAE